MNKSSDDSNIALYTGKNGPKTKVICSGCKKPGHAVENCWIAHLEKKKEYQDWKKAKDSKDPKDLDSDSNSKDEGLSLYSVAFMSSIENKWLVDTGAT